jgi:transposase
VKLAEVQGVPKTAENLGVPQNTLYRWRSEQKEAGQAAYPGKGSVKAEKAEVFHLQRELARVKQERDILKKALAIFSRG